MKRRLSLIPINTDRGGVCRTIIAGYFKMGFTNFTREFLGKKDGFTKTGILEIYEDCICKPQPGEELREGGME